MVLEHARVVSSMQKSFRTRVTTGSSPGVLINSTEHAGSFFITFEQLPYTALHSHFSLLCLVPIRLQKSYYELSKKVLNSRSMSIFMLVSLMMFS